MTFWPMIVVSPTMGLLSMPSHFDPGGMSRLREVTDAVHRVGGTIFAQLWHVGRVSHPDFHGGALPVAPSAIAVDGEVFTPRGREKIVVPRALALHELANLAGNSDSALDQFPQEGPMAAGLVHTRAGAEQRDRLTLSHPRPQVCDANAPRLDLGEIPRPVFLPGDGRARLPVRRRVQRAARA